MSYASTLANNFLKENYKPGILNYNVQKNYPLIQMARKTGNARFDYITGRYNFVPRVVGLGGGGASTLVAAQSKAAVNQLGTTVAFEMPNVAYYQYQQVPGQTWRQAEGNEAAFIDMFSKTLEDAERAMLQDLAYQFFSDGYLAIGQVAQITTTNVANDTVVLTSQYDALKFGPTRTFVQASLSRSSGTAKAMGSGVTTTGMQVKQVNTINATIVFNQSVLDATNGIPTLAVNDYLFNYGDVVATSSGVLPGLPGFEAWAPFGGTNDTANGNFYNVNRDVSNYLQGTSVDGTNGNSVLQTLRTALVRARSLNSAKVDTFVMNSNFYGQLEADLISQNRYTTDTLIMRPIAPALEVGQEEFTTGIHIGEGVICVQDDNARPDRIVGFNSNELELLVLNDGFRPWDLDGLTSLRGNTTDTLDIRFAQYHTLTLNPQNVITIKMNPTSV